MRTRQSTTDSELPPLTQQHETGKGEVRYAFVEMLFALAIAEVAIASSHLVSIERPFNQKIPAIAHLFVATTLIATSWLGWSTSNWRAKKSKSESPFSWDFLGLLLDVLLVVMYFIIVRLADISDKEPFDLLPPSAVPEARWIVWVFTVYALWDCLWKVLKEDHLWRLVQRSTVDVLKLALASMACSIICAGLACVVYLLAQSLPVPADVTLRWNVVCLDSALLCVVLLFRALKNYGEAFLYRNVVTLRQFSAFRVERAVNHRENTLVWVFVGLYMLFLALGNYS